MIPNHVITNKIPKLFYGTAWKEDQTEDLVFTALKAGFRAIDTANQRKHYNEVAVGKGLQRFLKETGKTKDEIFIQTKYTYARGQDHRKPYDENDSFTKQVKDSFVSSCEHLQLEKIDSFVLHGPYGPTEFSVEDQEAWAAMEGLWVAKGVTYLGVSNIRPAQLLALLEQATIAPTFVQNRCYAATGWDREVRAICSQNGIIYQGFSLLTANRKELSQEAVTQIARKYQKTIPQVVFRFCQQLGMVCLTGTSDSDHMREDLAIMDFELSESELHFLENMGVELD